MKRKIFLGIILILIVLILTGCKDSSINENFVYKSSKNQTETEEQIKNEKEEEKKEEMITIDYKKAAECFETHIALTNKTIDKDEYIYIASGMRNLSIIYKNDIIPYGSYNLHKKIAECYKKLGDEKNAQVHEKIMETMLSW